MIKNIYIYIINWIVCCNIIYVIFFNDICLNKYFCYYDINVILD